MLSCDILNTPPYELLFYMLLAAVMKTPVGSSKCSWGPAYWCSTPEAAIECNVRMCIKNTM